MSPGENNKYCNHHFDLVKNSGVMERALQDIDDKISKLFDKLDIIAAKNNTQDGEIQNMTGYLKAHVFHITIALSLLAVAVKLWTR